MTNKAEHSGYDVEVNGVHRAARILVVDDEKRIRDTCNTVLVGQGYHVVVAAEGKECIEQVKNEHFDVVLLDLMMPHVSGFDVLAQVRKLDPDAATIVITGYATLEHSVEAMKRGAFDFIPKPFTPDQLRVVVAKAIKYTTALQDITDARSRLRVVVDRLSDGVLTTDASGRIVLANPAFLRMVGYAGESAVGRCVEEVIDDEQLKRLIERTLNMPASEHTELSEELQRGCTDDNDCVHLTARCFPFRDRDSLNLGTVTLLNDITALKRMDQMKSEFVSLVAHEIRSPMGSVLAQMDILREGVVGHLTEKQRSILDRSSLRLRSLVSLVSDILDLAKIESGLLAQDRERFALGELVETLVSFSLPRATEAGITLTLEPLPETTAIVANRQGIEEALTNLLENGIKYTPAGGVVVIRVERDEHEARVSVRDSGYGISPEDQALVFKRFYRVKNETLRLITGTGLGLPIVKRIIEAHDGRVELASELGQGSTFTVHLPVAN